MMRPSRAVAVNISLATAAVFCFLFAVLLKYNIPKPYDVTNIYYISTTFKLHFGSDSWKPLNAAFQIWSNDPSSNVYAATFFKNLKFQYPPSAIALGYIPAFFHFQNYNIAYHVISLISFVLIIFCSERLISASLSNSTNGSSAIVSAIRLSIVAVLGVLFYPITLALEIGQIQVWIDGMFAAALLAWAYQLRVLPGILIGFICMIKPQLSLFVIWAVLRCEWRFAVVLAATGGVGLMISLFAFGLSNHLAYAEVLSILADRGESYYANQSINGLLNRLMSLVDPIGFSNLEFHSDRLPPHSSLVRYATMLSSLVIIALALLPRARPMDESRIFDFCLMGLACTMASPIAWEHHYGILFPMYGLLLVRAWGHKTWMIAIGLSYLLVSQALLFTNFLAENPLNIMQSYVLFGASILLVMLFLGPPRRIMSFPLRQRFGSVSATTS